ncbi:MAG: hypothetical protein FWG38_02915, partial [Defluviitaleaceae bacterium]|nr:hypothetical protein [Defluviitaleaceae bacterium]
VNIHITAEHGAHFISHVNTLALGINHYLPATPQKIFDNLQKCGRILANPFEKGRKTFRPFAGMNK